MAKTPLQTNQIENLSCRGTFSPSTVDEENRTVELVWGTDSPQVRQVWGEKYEEKLSFDPNSVDMSRLNSGAPLLNSHSAESLDAVIGVVERASIEAGKGKATVRFSKRESVEPIWNDVKDGVLRNISVGYRVSQYDVRKATDKSLELRTAVQWEPFEVSLVPMGVDRNAQVRSLELMDGSELETAVVETEETRAEVLTPAAVPPDPVPPNEGESLDAKLQRAIKMERDRVTQIRSYGQAAGVNDAYLEALIDQGATVELAATRILSDVARGQVPIRSTRVEVTRDEGEHLLRSFEGQLLYRIGVEKELPEESRQYRHHSLLDMARSICERRGLHTSDLSKSELVSRAISTDDFPILFTTLTRRTLLPAYEQAPQTWKPFASQQNLPDFRPYQEVDLSADMYPREIAEGGEYQRSYFLTGEGQWFIKTYGREFVVTRQAIINDDLSSLNRVPLYLGRAFADMESDFVYALLTMNGGLGTNVAGATGAAPLPLFAPAHQNTITAGTISVATIGEARTLLRNRRDLANNRVVLQPDIMLVPPNMETEAEVFLGPIVPNVIGGVNIFTNKLRLISEPRLVPDLANGQPDPAFLNDYYILANPGQVPMVTYGYLSGDTGPSIVSEPERNPDGVKILSRIDFGCTIQNYRGFIKILGA